jgi:hypothetical protein
MDLTSGTYYFGHRYYQPNLQRWLNQDPIGERGGLNLYGYVGNNPVNKIDPLGLWQVTITFGEIIGFRFTFGNNGGTGLFNGQWNQGVQVGLGEGASFDLDTTSSKCHEKNTFVKGVDLSGDIGLGPHIEGHTHMGDDPSWDINFGVPHTFAGGQIGTEGASAPTLSFGESLFGGYGGTRYY